MWPWFHNSKLWSGDWPHPPRDPHGGRTLLLLVWDMFVYPDVHSYSRGCGVAGFITQPHLHRKRKSSLFSLLWFILSRSWKEKQFLLVHPQFRPVLYQSPCFLFGWHTSFICANTSVVHEKGLMLKKGKGTSTPELWDSWKSPIDQRIRTKWCKEFCTKAAKFPEQLLLGSLYLQKDLSRH